MLVNFLRDVAEKASGEGGNKMDIQNLAMVIAPNILYAKSKDKHENSASAKDESFLAIDAVKMIIDLQDSLWTVGVSGCGVWMADMLFFFSVCFYLVFSHNIKVPDDIYDVLTSEDAFPENTTDLSSKDVIRKYEMLMANKKSHSSREIFTDVPTYPQGTVAAMEYSGGGAAAGRK